VIPVSIRSVVKRFGRVRALDDVTLDIERGELFFLLGPSGCGKTTLLRTIAGFYTPDASRVLFGDTDVTVLPPQRRNTGMVFQNYALWPHMSVEANVAFGLKVRHVPRRERNRRVAEALATVRMAPYARRKPNQLSGGQQQRVAIARAIATNPTILLADEPTGALDQKTGAAVMDLFHELNDEGRTIIMITHDAKIASHAGRIVRILDGDISEGNLEDA